MPRARVRWLSKSPHRHCFQPSWSRLLHHEHLWTLSAQSPSVATCSSFWLDRNCHVILLNHWPPGRADQLWEATQPCLARLTVGFAFGRSVAGFNMCPPHTPYCLSWWSVPRSRIACSCLLNSGTIFPEYSGEFRNDFPDFSGRFSPSFWFRLVNSGTIPPRFFWFGSCPHWTIFGYGDPVALGTGSSQWTAPNHIRNDVCCVAYWFLGLFFGTPRHSTSWWVWVWVYEPLGRKDWVKDFTRRILTREPQVSHSDVPITCQLHDLINTEWGPLDLVDILLNLTGAAGRSYRELRFAKVSPPSGLICYPLLIHGGRNFTNLFFLTLCARPCMVSGR